MKAHEEIVQAAIDRYESEDIDVLDTVADVVDDGGGAWVHALVWVPDEDDDPEEDER